MNKIFAIQIIFLLASCSSVPVQPVEPRPEVDAQAIGLLTDNCNPVTVERVAKPGDVLCDRVSFHQGLLGCIGYLEAAGLCKQDLKTCQAMNLVDVAELEASVAFERSEKESAKRARWWWGLGGVGVGAVVVGLLVGLLR